jgi:hypothetical protein
MHHHVSQSHQEQATGAWLRSPPGGLAGSQQQHWEHYKRMAADMLGESPCGTRYPPFSGNSINTARGGSKTLARFLCLCFWRHSHTRTRHVWRSPQTLVVCRSRLCVRQGCILARFMRQYQRRCWYKRLGVSVPRC